MPSEVIESISTDNLMQAYLTGTEMALVRRSQDGSFTAVTPFAFCKDYFPDIYWGRATKQNVDVYGFTWKTNIKEQSYLVNDWQYFAIRDKSGDISSRIKQTQKYLNIFDKARGYNLTKVMPSKNNSMFIVQFDKKWTKYPVMLSLFMQNIRMGMSYDGTSVKTYLSNAKNRKVTLLNNQDYNRIDFLDKGVTDLLNKEWIPDRKYSDYTNIRQCHNASGFMAYYNKYRDDEEASYNEDEEY